MLTRSGWAVAAGAIGAAVAGRLLGVTELYIFASVAGALVVLALVLVRRPIPRLTVERRVHPARPTVGGNGRVDVSVTNHGPGHLANLSLVDPVEGTVGARMVVGPLAAGARQHAGYRLPHLQRGLLHLGPLTAEVGDPFGLARRRLPGAPLAVVTVVPRIDPAPELPMGGGRHEPLSGLSRRVVASSGAEDLVTLRPYVVGDDLRRVHWPSTAHADEVQVRRDEERWQGHLTVLLDTRADACSPEAFERAVSAAAGIVDAVAARGDRVRFCTTSGHDSGMVDAQRCTHALFDDLAMVDPDPSTPIDLPQADPRHPVAMVVLTGDDPASLVAVAEEHGWHRLIPVCFVEAGEGVHDAPGVAPIAAVTVVGDEPLAAAWSRT